MVSNIIIPFSGIEILPPIVFLVSRQNLRPKSSRRSPFRTVSCFFRLLRISSPPIVYDSDIFSIFSGTTEKVRKFYRDSHPPSPNRSECEFFTGGNTFCDDPQVFMVVVAVHASATAASPVYHEEHYDGHHDDGHHHLSHGPPPATSYATISTTHVKVQHPPAAPPKHVSPYKVSVRVIFFSSKKVLKQKKNNNNSFYQEEEGR